MTKFRTDDKRAAVLITAATLALAILFTACPQKAKAKPAKPNVPSIFKTDGNGIIIGYTCEKDDLPKALVIPAKIGAEDITGIGYKAFQNCTGLTSLDLSGCASLTTIDMNAFQDCTGLTSLDLSGCASLTTIDMNAFKGCTGLTDVRFHENLAKIGVQAFNGCTGLTDVQFPEKLTEIGWRAFYDCKVLTSVIFADKTRWAVYDDDKYNTKYADITSDDLDDSSKAAKYLLKSTYNGGYNNKYWKKN